MPNPGKTSATSHLEEDGTGARCAEPPAVAMLNWAVAGLLPACRVAGEKEHELLAGRLAQEKRKVWPAAPLSGLKFRV